MRASLSIALLLLGTALTSSAQSDCCPSITELTSTKQEALAIQKTLILATLLQAEEHAEGSTLESSEQNMKRCIAFAQAQGAPARFIDLLKASAQASNIEDSTQLAEQIEELLSNYSIDTLKLHIWTSICQMDAASLESWLNGDKGSQELHRELQSAEPSFVATLSDEERQGASDAIKKSLLLLNFYNIKDKLRITDEHLAQLLDFAEEQGAPRMFTRLLAADSSRNIAPNMHYEVNKYLDQLLKAYLIDRKTLRLYAEACGTATDDMIQLISSPKNDEPFYPCYSFNLLPRLGNTLSDEELKEASEQWLQDTRKLAEMLTGITAANAKQLAILDIAKLIPSYMRVQSIQQKREPELAQQIESVHSGNLRHLLMALKVTQEQLYRLLLLKDELPLPLRALLVQFI